MRREHVTAAIRYGIDPTKGTQLQCCEKLIDALIAQRQPTRAHRLEQIGILVLSAVAIALVDHADGTQWRFWGNVIGLTAQPLWFVSTWRHGQWGMFFLTVFYTGIWSAGVYRYF